MSQSDAGESKLVTEITETTQSKEEAATQKANDADLVIVEKADDKAASTDATIEDIGADTSLDESLVGANNDSSICPTDEIITLNDVLNEQHEMDLEYAAVLGGSDPKSCTYAQGYVKRQALYACLTCTPEARTDSAQRAGVCLACSYSCHEGHELVELYTKRSFRCDCGTARILAVRCRLTSPGAVKSEPINELNRYNQNFSGVYCTCHRPYPDTDPEADDDEMIQCVVCEDWYHTRHLGVASVPLSGDFAEMVCAGCMEKNQFLWHYGRFQVAEALKGAKEAEEEVEEVAKENGDEKPAVDDKSEEKTNGADNGDGKTESTVEVDKKPDDTNNAGGQFTDEINQCIQDIIEINKSSSSSSTDVLMAGEDSVTAATTSTTASDDGTQPATKKQKLNDATEKPTAMPAIDDDEDREVDVEKDVAPVALVGCRKPPLPIAARQTSKTPRRQTGATFWPDGWRARLCACDVCVLQMQRKNVSFLLDAEDTVRCYEEKGLSRVNEGEQHPEYDRAMSALSQLGHGAQVDMIVGYNKLKEKLTEFLRGFVANGQVVTEADIKRFFSMMRAGGGAGNQ